jgi:hypothetical protein
MSVSLAYCATPVRAQGASASMRTAPRAAAAPMPARAAGGVALRGLAGRVQTLQARSRAATAPRRGACTSPIHPVERGVSAEHDVEAARAYPGAVELDRVTRCVAGFAEAAQPGADGSGGCGRPDGTRISSLPRSLTLWATATANGEYGDDVATTLLRTPSRAPARFGPTLSIPTRAAAVWRDLLWCRPGRMFGHQGVQRGRYQRLCAIICGGFKTDGMPRCERWSAWRWQPLATRPWTYHDSAGMGSLLTSSTHPATVRAPISPSRS